MTVRSSHFHPDVITFRWFCEGGELSPVASQASSSPRPNSEGFFSAFSQCKLHRSELEKGSTKVWVSVHHIALRQPITRETRGEMDKSKKKRFKICFFLHKMLVRRKMADVFPRIFTGFLKRPSVSDVISSASPLDQTVILGCQITDFFPPNISVTWLRLREGERDDREEEVIEGGEMWGPIQTQSRLYRATATLKRRATSQEKKEKGGFGGGGIICRVEHISLQEPIEKHWKSIDIGINLFSYC